MPLILSQDSTGTHFLIMCPGQKKLDVDKDTFSRVFPGLIELNIAVRTKYTAPGANEGVMVLEVQPRPQDLSCTDGPECKEAINNITVTGVSSRLIKQVSSCEMELHYLTFASYLMVMMPHSFPHAGYLSSCSEFAESILCYFSNESMRGY